MFHICSVLQTSHFSWLKTFNVGDQSGLFKEVGKDEKISFVSLFHVSDHEDTHEDV